MFKAFWASEHANRRPVRHIYWPDKDAIEEIRIQRWGDEWERRKNKLEMYSFRKINYWDEE